MNPFARDRLGGALAVAVGIGGIGYGIAFMLYLSNGSPTAAKVSDVFLLVGGVLATGAFTGVYQRLRESEPTVALWGLILGAIAFGATAIHGGYNIATEVKAVGDPVLKTSPVDPRGLMAFGVTGLAVAAVSWVLLVAKSFPRALAFLGFLDAAALIALYVGRLVFYNPKSGGMLAVAALAAFVANPAWFVWLGASLLRNPASPPAGRAEMTAESD